MLIPTKEAVIRAYPPGFFDGKTDDFVYLQHMKQMCDLQAKEYMKQEVYIRTLESLSDKQKAELDKCYGRIADLTKEADRPWWKRIWGKK